MRREILPRDHRDFCFFQTPLPSQQVKDSPEISYCSSASYARVICIAFHPCLSEMFCVRWIYTRDLCSCFPCSCAEPRVLARKLDKREKGVVYCAHLPKFAFCISHSSSLKHRQRESKFHHPQMAHRKDLLKATAETMPVAFSAQCVILACLLSVWKKGGSKSFGNSLTLTPSRSIRH